MRSSILMCIGALAMSLGVTATPVLTEKGKFSLPLDSKDGLYVHSVDENGVASFEYLGTVPPTGEAPGLEANALLKRAGEGPQCGGAYVDSRDWDGAIDAFIATCRAGNPARVKKSLSVRSGNAVAYSCDYGKGHDCWGDQVNSFFTSLKGTCGNSQASYYNLPKSKASYGVTSVGVGFC
jgi:hypothetical protein